uniref:Uncharacterized protein n=1 Tax=Coccidioides posadasii RMSCC 3488 TaxID=454284 RepID=A0A0J6F216_COCPO|nr:hypothetical protein CPAG_03272 [Coccidioides posadasii RMSCC 3488]
MSIPFKIVAWKQTPLVPHANPIRLSQRPKITCPTRAPQHGPHGLAQRRILLLQRKQCGNFAIGGRTKAGAWKVSLGGSGVGERIQSSSELPMLDVALFCLETCGPEVPQESEWESREVINEKGKRRRKLEADSSEHQPAA